MIKKYIQSCSCGQVEGKKTILNNKAHVGITTEFTESGTFKNNTALFLENRFCPECGKAHIAREFGTEGHQIEIKEVLP